MFLIRLYQKGLGFVMKKVHYRKPKCYVNQDAYKKIIEIIYQNKKQRPFIVASLRTLQQDRFQIVQKELADAIYFSEVTQEPTDLLVEKMVDEYHYYHCDCVIAIGGGSILDASKALLARLTREKRSLNDLKGVLKIRKSVPLFIGVPTTAGTGSESSITTVIKDHSTHFKYTINDPSLICHYALLDPTLTYTLNRKQTYYGAMDALCHAIEAYLNEAYHRKDTKEKCLQVIKLITYYLPIACKEPENNQARLALLLASYQAGMCFSEACVGNIHALAHALGGKYNLAHSEMIALLMPMILDDYGSVIETPLQEMVTYLGSHFKTGKQWINYLKQQNEQMGVSNISFEMSEKDKEEMASAAYKEANPLYPVPVIYTKDRFKNILNKLDRKEGD